MNLRGRAHLLDAFAVDQNGGRREDISGAWIQQPAGFDQREGTGGMRSRWQSRNRSSKGHSKNQRELSNRTRRLLYHQPEQLRYGTLHDGYFSLLHFEVTLLHCTFDVKLARRAASNLR